MTSTATCTKHLYTLQGKKIGIGNVDIDITKTLVGEDRKLALKAFLDDTSPYSPMIDYSHGALMLYFVYQAQGYVASGELSIASILMMLVALYFFIDIISGLLHLTLDNPWFLVDSPLDSLCRGFHEHHLDTTLICKMNIWPHIRVINTPVFYISLVGMCINYNRPLFYCYPPALTLGLYYMQMCHRWAHMKQAERGPFVTMMQTCGLAISPTGHMQHHSPPYTHSFCIMNGWANPIINFFMKNVPGLSNHSRYWALIFVGMCLIPLLLF